MDRTAPTRQVRLAPSLAMLAAALVGGAALGNGCAAGRHSVATPSEHAAPAKEHATAGGVATTVETWRFLDAPGRVLRTTSYRILTTDQSPLVADRMPVFLETALLTYRTMLGPLPEPRSPLEVYLMANRGQWETLTRQTAGPRADIYLRIQRGGYSENGRAVFYNIGPRDTFAIAGHEGWHQYTQSVFREALPIWLEEGISVCMEGFRWNDSGDAPVFLAWSNLERYDRLRELVAAGRAVGLDRLLHQRPQDLLQDSGLATLDYYAQIWALTLFLREGAGGAYRPALERMVRDAADGGLASRISAETSPREARTAMLSRVGDAAFRAYFGDVAEASRAYEEFVRTAVRPGGREHVLMGRSPIP